MFVIVDIDDPTLRTIVKYPKHTSILAIKEIGKKLFYFSHLTLEEVFKEINLHALGTILEIHIPRKIVKENLDIFAFCIFKVSIIYMLHPVA